MGSLEGMWITDAWVWLLPLLWCRGGFERLRQVPKAWARIPLGCSAVGGYATNR